MPSSKAFLTRNLSSPETEPHIITIIHLSPSSASTMGAASFVNLLHLTSSSSSPASMGVPPCPFKWKSPLPVKSVSVSCRCNYNERSRESEDVRSSNCLSRREMTLIGGAVGMAVIMASEAKAGSLEEDYAKETKEVIERVRSTIDMDKSDPNTSTAVTVLRETSNNWVAKYRREKQLAGKPSFSNMYSVLNAISGHYISFGPSAPIPAKRKARILEEMDTAEKALSRGR